MHSTEPETTHRTRYDLIDMDLDETQPYDLVRDLIDLPHGLSRAHAS